MSRPPASMSAWLPALCLSDPAVASNNSEHKRSLHEGRMGDQLTTAEAVTEAERIEAEEETEFAAEERLSTRREVLQPGGGDVITYSRRYHLDRLETVTKGSDKQNKSDQNGAEDAYSRIA